MMTAKSFVAHYHLCGFSLQPGAVGRLQHWTYFTNRRKAECLRIMMYSRGIVLALLMLKIDQS